MATESDAPNGHPIKREDIILPTTQMEGACLSVKLSHQSLHNPMPHGEWGDPQKVLKSKQCLEKGGLGASAMEPLAPLHLKSEATR